ncbi:hypothetical protein [Pontibacter chitinilyticus]|uniref:hypothetical protein n=1 Tax=Pontibacter chitinilyticus TaxID=2674989 RepID=UPI00321AFFD9
MNTIKFIKGRFTPEDAKEILLDVISRKINFHNLKDFSSHIRFNKPDVDSRSRVEELKAARELILAITEEAVALNSNLIVESTINIMLEAKDQPKGIFPEVADC